MPHSPDIVIIGAGLIGLSCADSLAARGAKVTVLDARPGPVQGASFSNSGMIHPSQSRSWAPDLPDDTDVAKAVLNLARRSRDMLLKNMSRLRLNDMARRPEGCVQIFDTFETARRHARTYDALGVRCEYMADPQICFDKPALYFPDDRSGNAHDYGTALATELEAQGVHIIYSVKNITLNASPEGVTVLFGESVLTPDHVVVAAGHSSPDLLAPLGITPPIEGVAGHALNFTRPDMPLPNMPVMDASSRSAVSVFGEILRISGGWNLPSADPMLARWTEIAPELMSALGEPQPSWTGIRPQSRLGRPIIGPSPIAGLWINAGHGHNGWTLSAGSGALMADMILDGQDDPRFTYPV